VIPASNESTVVLLLAERAIQDSLLLQLMFQTCGSTPYRRLTSESTIGNPTIHIPKGDVAGGGLYCCDPPSWARFCCPNNTAEEGCVTTEQKCVRVGNVVPGGIISLFFLAVAIVGYLSTTFYVDGTKVLTKSSPPQLAAFELIFIALAVLVIVEVGVATLTFFAVEFKCRQIAKVHSSGGKDSGKGSTVPLGTEGSKASAKDGE